MEDYNRSKSNNNGYGPYGWDGKMEIQSYHGGRPSSFVPNDYRTNNYTTTASQQAHQVSAANNNDRDTKLKKSGKNTGGSSSSSSSKIWCFNDPELQRKKRVASYKVYSVEGKMKGSFRKSFRWLKDRYTKVIYGLCLKDFVRTMGRRIPSTAMISSINPAFSITLLAASVAVMVAIIGALCAAKSRKNTSPPQSPSSRRKTSEPSNRGPESETTIAVQQSNNTTSGSSSSSPEDSNSKLVLQEQQQVAPTPMNLTSMNSVKSNKRRLSSSLSMKIPTGNALAKFKARKEEGEQQKKDKSSSKGEDSLWMKTIILGEKCRVPNEEDAINYDHNGNRIASYPARTPRSLPVSRTHSLIDQDYNI